MARQGRPLGSKSGPRPTIFVALMMIDGKPTNIRFEKKVDSEQEYTDNEVRQACVDKYGSTPLEIHGPFHDKKGGVKTASQIKQNKEAKVEDTDLSEEEISGVIGQASFEEWQGTAYEIEGSEKVRFIPSKHLTDPSKLPAAARTLTKDQLTFDAAN